MFAFKFAAYRPPTARFNRQLKTTLKNCFSALNIMSPSVMNDSDRYCYNPTLIWNPEVEEYFVKAYGADHFARISKALTCPSSYCCIRVNTLKTSTDAIVQKLLNMLKETRIVNGNKIQSSLEQQHAENHSNTPMDNIDEGSQGGLESVVVKCPIPELDYVVFVHGTGPHKIDYEPASSQPLKEVVVSRKCAEAVLRGAQIFVPGVLACSAHVEKGDEVAVSVGIEQREDDGKWATGITRGIILQGLQTDAQYLQRKGLYIGQGTTMMSRAGIFRALQGVAICMNNRVFDLPCFNNVLEGEIFLQNLPSIITAHVLDPQKGERIIDMCAAPGGKTTAIAMRMKDDGVVVAVDRSHNKVQGIRNLADEMGFKSIVAYKLDALKSVSWESEQGKSCTSNGTEETLASKPLVLCIDPEKDGISNENVNLGAKAEKKKTKQRLKNGPGKNQVSGVRVEKSKGFPPNSFDRVLLDAPCSALGLRPRLFAGEETLDSLRSHTRYQRRMFDQAVQLVRPGGVIVYSTCTINPGENEALVRYALDTYKFLSLAPQSPKVGGPGLVGSFKFSNGSVEEWLRPGEEELVQRFDPSSMDTIGFFIAKFNVGSKDT